MAITMIIKNTYYLLILFFFCTFVARLQAQPGNDFSLQIGSPDSSEYVSAFMVDNNEDIFVATIVFRKGNSEQRFKLFKISKEGTVIWSKLYPEKKITIFSILKQLNGDLVMAGSIEHPNGKTSGSEDLYLMKTDAMGNKIWEKAVKSDVRGCIMEIYQANGGFIIRAYEYYDDATGMSNKIDYLIKTNLQGKVLWEKKFPSPKKGNGPILRPLKNGDFLFVPAHERSAEKQPLQLLTIRPNGKLRQKTIRDFEINDVAETEKGQLVFLVEEQIKGDSGTILKKQYLKKIQSDSLAAISKIVEGASVCPVQKTKNGMFIPFVVDKQYHVLKLNNRFEKVGEALIPKDENAFVDAVFITEKEELLFNRILRLPLNPEAVIYTKSKFNYDILLEKVQIRRFYRQ